MQRYSVAALVLELKAGAEVQMLPAGTFRATDGRPAEVPAWKMDARIAANVIRKARLRASRLVIDFEHQSLMVAANGQPAPAAGWFKTLLWREGAGLFATDIEWTARAKQMIEAGEYRYLSPVFSYDAETGEVLEMLMAAVTNVPALDGMAELALRAAAKFDLNHEDDMNDTLKKLLAGLGIAETATEADALGAIAALKEKAGRTDALTTEVAALKAQTPDPARYVPVAAMKELQTQVTALTAATNQRDLDELIAKALADAKLLPAQEKWARDLGKTNIAALKDYVASAQAIPALMGTQSGGRGPGAAAGGDIVAAAKAEFESNAQLRQEFTDLAVYTAWRKAEAESRVKILGRTQH